MSVQSGYKLKSFFGGFLFCNSLLVTSCIVFLYFESDPLGLIFILFSLAWYILSAVKHDGWI